MASEGEEYPGLRSALRSDAAVNLYCGLKWLAWQLFHALYVVVGGAVLLVFGTIAAGYLAAKLAGHYALRAFNWVYVEYIRPNIPGETATSALSSGSLTVQRVHQKSQDHSVLRYIYGHCPVDVKADTRWYARLSTRAKTVGVAVESALTPPEYVRRCENCGDVTDLEFISRCTNCGERGTYESVRKSEVEADDAE